MTHFHMVSLLVSFGYVLMYLLRLLHHLWLVLLTVGNVKMNELERNSCQTYSLTGLPMVVANLPLDIVCNIHTGISMFGDLNGLINICKRVYYT